MGLLPFWDPGARFFLLRGNLLVEQIARGPADGHVLVDTGSSAFVPLLHYLMTNDVPAVLSQVGHHLVVHTVVTGGEALTSTETATTDIDAIDDFICQDCTDWCGLGVIDLLAAALDLPEPDRGHAAHV
jgi:hypothetical protein